MSWFSGAEMAKLEIWRRVGVAQGLSLLYGEEEVVDFNLEQTTANLATRSGSLGNDSENQVP
jgi:hypothetical protein